MRKYSIYIFDFDGTVADSSKDVWASIEYALNCLNLSLPSYVCEDCANLALSSTALYRLITKGQDEAGEIKFAELVRYHYRNLNTFKKTELYPEIERLLCGLGRTASCHLASNKAQVALFRLLKSKGWNSYFSSVQGTVPEGNVTKENMIRNILQDHPDILPKDVLFIGDSGTDVTAARENKIPVIGVTYGDGDTAKLLVEKPDFVVHSSQELYKLLLNM